MEIYFDDIEVAELVQNNIRLSKCFDINVVKKINQRLTLIESFENIEVLQKASIFNTRSCNLATTENFCIDITSDVSLTFTMLKMNKSNTNSQIVLKRLGKSCKEELNGKCYEF